MQITLCDFGQSVQFPRCQMSVKKSSYYKSCREPRGKVNDEEIEGKCCSQIAVGKDCFHTELELVW